MVIGGNWLKIIAAFGQLFCCVFGLVYIWVMDKAIMAQGVIVTLAMLALLWPASNAAGKIFIIQP